MSSPDESITPEVLDEAIKLLYSSRPAKAAALLGLVDPSNPISLAPKAETEKVALRSGPILDRGFSPVTQNKPVRDSGKIGDMAAGGAGAYSVDMSRGPSALTLPRPEKTVSIAKGDGIDNSGVASARGERTTVASLNKEAMTEQEYMLYQAGIDPSLAEGDSASLTPKQLAALGGGSVGVAAANRMRAKNVAGRELRDIRRNYLDAVRDNALTKQQLKNLNAELKLRGAKPNLKLAPTLGIADAHMAQAEKQLTQKVLKQRYRGALPLLAAGLIGTLAYNKLNEV